MSVDEPFYYVEPIENGLAHAIQIGDHQIMLIHRRRNYRAFNETPTTEGNPMLKKPSLAKLASKLLLSAVFSAAIGYAIKAEKIIEERIDARYDEPKDDSDQNN